MNYPVILACRGSFFFLKCFGIGVSVAAAVGPIFVLTFNRAASRGWLVGFATGLGSALADSCYFVLGLLGVLKVITQFPSVLQGMYLAGGMLIVLIGSNLLRTGLAPLQDRQRAPRYLALMSQAFGMTIANPSVLLFFIAVSARVLGGTTMQLTPLTVMLAVCAMLSGSCVMYAATCTAGWLMGHRMPAWLLRRITQVVGGGMILFGLFLIYTRPL